MSEFDVSMIITADIGYVPKGFKNRYNVSKSSVFETKGNDLFSEEFLIMCIKKIAEYK